jgi:hypothetical protein
MGPVGEWFVNGPLGVEQGFDLLRRPSGSGMLRLELALSRARVRLDGHHGALISPDGGGLLRYTGLSAVDAAGRALPAWLAVTAGELSIVVDDRGARYPVRVDPFIQNRSKLVGTGATGGGQGFGVAISSDGNTLLIGGPWVNGNLAPGAAWVFTRSGGVWSQQAELTPSDEMGNGEFGSSVALSSDGNTALIGGPGDNNYAGATWVFTRYGGVWSQQGLKLVGIGATSAAGQGTSVALSGDGNTALTGGPFDNSDGGAVWVFTRAGGVWSQQGSKLVGTGGSGGEQGWSVALSSDGNTALAGGPADTTEAGAVWAYSRTAGVWNQQGSKLTPSDEAPSGRFGFSVALSGDGSTALIGGPGNAGVGAAWVFTNSGGAWSQQGLRLTASDETGAGFFGRSVALSADGNTAVIGGPDDNSYAGAAWVFTRSAGVWNQQGAKLVASDEAGGGELGTSISLSGDGGTAVTGGPDDNSYAGAAWVFSTQHTLTVVNAGSGSGTVTSSPSGISCGSTCSAEYTAGMQVMLSATPAPGSVFTGWSGGGCSGTGSCSVTLSADQMVIATFSRAAMSAPVLSGLSVSPRKSSLVGRLVHGQCKALNASDRHDKSCRLRLSLRVAFNLSGAGSVTLAFSRLGPGRLVNRHCVKSTFANHHRPQCKLLTMLGGGLTRTVGSGPNTITIVRSSLPPASYQLTVTPSAAGKAGKPDTTNFMITA